MRKSVFVMFFLVTLIMVSCSQNTNGLPKVAATLEGKVVNLTEGYFLLASRASGLISVQTNSQIYNEKNQKVDVVSLRNGQLVEIGFSGMIMESYPGQLGAVDYIKIVSEEEDLVGLYSDILREILAREGVLKAEDSYVVLDVSQVSRLSEVEKDALVNFAPSPFGVIGVMGSEEDYLTQGYSDQGVFIFLKSKRKVTSI